MISHTADDEFFASFLGIVVLARVAALAESSSTAIELRLRLDHSNNAGSWDIRLGPFAPGRTVSSVHPGLVGPDVWE